VQFHVVSRVVTQTELALRPESVAIGAFGGIAGLVCLILVLQALARLLRERDEDRSVLRALGATRAAVAADGVPGLLAALAVGTLLAVGVAIALSPLAPFGPVRRVDPDLGVAVDGLVLLGGAALLLVGLGGATLLLAWWRSRPGNDRARPARRSVVAGQAASAGLPLSCVVGTRFALEPGSGRTAVPLRSALIGTAAAILLVVTTLTFASSFDTLVTHPPLYGWNWSAALLPTNNVPLSTLASLDHDARVAGWWGVDYNTVEIDHEDVPVLMDNRGRGGVGLAILSGHGVEGAHQIVLGSATLAALHKQVGDTVTVGVGTPATRPFYITPTTMRIVGTGTFPAVGYESLIADHTSMGTGALFSEAFFPAGFKKLVVSPDPNLAGPELVFVRFRPGVSASAQHADLTRLADQANRVFATDRQVPPANVVTILGVQRPAQIVNYRSIVSTPLVLAVALSFGALLALGLTLVASVRRRRWDLAMLKTLGCTPRQLVAAVSWQSTITALVGVLIGVPLGIVLGRQLWDLFARGLDAVPDPTVPAAAVALVAVGALVFANLVALLPGRAAGRTPTSAVLHAD
jgi:hypothetical protein